MNKLTLTCFSTLACTAAVFAGESAPLQRSVLQTDLGPTNWLDGKYATGNWGGLRDRLEERGVNLFAYYTNNIAGNASGGRKQGGFTYTDDFYFGVKLELDKLLGWQGAALTVSGVNRDGRSLTEQYVGSRYNSQQVYGGQNIFLYQLFLEQRLFNDKVSLKLGRFGASDDFNGSPIYSLYMNNGIDGDIRNVLFDTQFSAYPFATWAARLRFDPTPEINAQIGVFQTWNDIFDRSHNGLDWSVRGEDGTFIIAQVGWTPELFKRPVDTAYAEGKTEADGKATATPQLKGLPGHYWVGASLSPWEYPQFGTTEKADKSYGFYAHADQQVTQEQPGSNQGLTVWAASGLYPQEEISIVPFQVNGGLVYKGLLPARDEDRTLLGVIYGRFSRDYARTTEDLGQGNPRYELVIEAGHRIQLTKFAYIQPDVQYIVRPGGTGVIGDALILGAQMGVTF